MDLQDEIKALKQRIVELEEQAEQEKDFPKVGDEYWYISSNGYILDDYNDGIPGVEVGLLEIGNVFKTKEQAEFSVEKLKVEAELRKFSGHFENGKSNIEIYYYHEFDGIMLNSMKSSQTQGAIYFESEEKAQQAIKSVGKERIKKYIFGMED